MRCTGRWALPARALDAHLAIGRQAKDAGVERVAPGGEAQILRAQRLALAFVEARALQRR